MENSNDAEEESGCERSAMTPEEEQKWREQTLLKPAETDYQNCRTAIEQGEESNKHQDRLESFLGHSSDYQHKYNIETSGQVLSQCRALLHHLRCWSRKSRDISLAITHLESVEDRLRRDRADLFGKPY